MNTLDAERRVAFVVSGVVRQAMADAGVATVRFVAPPAGGRPLIERWCGVANDDDSPLTVSAATKTELLLATHTTRADLYPLGDLYASELAAFGVADLSDDLHQLAALAGGIEFLDGALRRLLDERQPLAAAFAGLPHIREAVMTRLQKTRFRRAHMGIIPKLGSRTIGIDLQI